MKRLTMNAVVRLSALAASSLLGVGCDRVEPGGAVADPAPVNAPAAAPAAVAAPAPLAEPTAVGAPTKTPSGLTYETLEPGDGPQAKRGETVSVHYISTFSDGKPLDSTREKGAPLTFKLGADAVMQGMDEGIAGMKVGETRKLTVPPNLGYGALGKLPEIPPNSTLVFEIELIGVGGE